MKTAEEWWDESCPTFENGQEVKSWVEQIQLDAFKAGRDRAAIVAQKVSDEKTWGISDRDTRYVDAILADLYNPTTDQLPK